MQKKWWLDRFSCVFLWFIFPLSKNIYRKLQKIFELKIAFYHNKENQTYLGLLSIRYYPLKSWEIEKIAISVNLRSLGTSVEIYIFLKIWHNAVENPTQFQSSHSTLVPKPLILTKIQIFLRFSRFEGGYLMDWSAKYICFCLLW